MNSRAGVVTSQVAWFAGLPVFVYGDSLEQKIKNAAAGFIVAGLASYAPDLDHGSATAGRAVGARNSKIIRCLMGGHRMGTHSLLAVLGAWWLTYYLLDNASVANAVAVGIGAHIFTDMLTVDGVGWLWPVWKTKTQIGWITTGSKTEDTYVTWVKCSSILVAIWYGWLVWPTIELLLTRSVA